MINPEDTNFTDNAANQYHADGFAGNLEAALSHMGIERIDEEATRGLIESATLDSALQTLDYINAAVNGSVERPDHAEVTSSVALEIDGKQVVGQLLLAPRHREILRVMR